MSSATTICHGIFSRLLPLAIPSRILARSAVALACALACGLAAGCGKKGPPLPPYAKAPAAPADVSARRVGNRVEIRFTVPVMDLDRQQPAHIDRVEVWAITGQVADPVLFRKYATLVGTVPVRRPPPPPPDVKEGEPPPPPPPPSTEPGLDQGQPGIVVDELTSDELIPIVVPEIEKQNAQDEQARQLRLASTGPLLLTPPDVGTPLPPPLTRYYIVMGRNGGRRGALTTRLAVPLRGPPPAPPQPTATAAENYVELAWTPPAGLRQPVSKGTAMPVAAASVVAHADRPLSGQTLPRWPKGRHPRRRTKKTTTNRVRPRRPGVEAAQPPAIEPPAEVAEATPAVAPAAAKEALGRPGPRRRPVASRR